MDVNQMVSVLRNETIQTWFDLGLFIDRFKENMGGKETLFPGSFDEFIRSISEGGIAFITFTYSIDGASIEIKKYAKAFQSIIEDVPLHYIAGKFEEKGELLIPPSAKRFQLDELASFDEWELYKFFFYKKLKRGSKIYNKLINQYWSEVLMITEKLGRYLEDNNIELMYLINTNSNPGNLSLALAVVFISEYLGIPVINNNHDFYWESGHSEIDIQIKGEKPGPRDHFFKNYHLGEVFSLLEMIYPWESRSWLSLNINHKQSGELIKRHGHNPGNIAQIGTAIKCENYKKEMTEDEKKKVLRQIASIFGNFGKNVPVHSIAKLLQRKPTSPGEVFPMLIGAEEKKNIDFETGNIIFLQPTRIISRKTIEVNYTLVEKLLGDDEFVDFLRRSQESKITILVTGPIATGHFNYFLKLLVDFHSMVNNLNPEVRDRILMGFLFSEFDKATFKQKYPDPFDICELFNIASLVLLPSSTEGRGLPILEAAAAGVPIFCRRFSPQEVYSKVIGEHLPREFRIKTLDFTDPNLNPEIIESVKLKIFSPKGFESTINHNREVIDLRFSPLSLKQEIESILHRLYLQVTSGEESGLLAKTTLKQYNQHLEKNKVYAQKILSTKNRQYLPGYGQMAYMLQLKSLIDPSYFRVEEKRLRGMAMQFAQRLVDKNPDPEPLSQEDIHLFYNGVDAIFHYREGETELRMDHSFAYRHRNKKYFPYRDLTPQELTGVINLIFNSIASPPLAIQIKKIEGTSDDWTENLPMLYGNSELAIDHIDELERKLLANIPIALFPKDQIELEIELFVLQSVRQRLGLKRGEKIRPQHLANRKLAPIFIIQRDVTFGEAITADVLKSHIHYSTNSELKLLFKHGICKIISSKQLSSGIHFYEVGQEVVGVLEQVKDGKGIMISFGDDAAMMTDIVDLDRFHIGEVSHPLSSKIMGIPLGSGYVQWVPAGMRFALAYPVPVQTGKDFSRALKSSRYKKLCDSRGEDEILKLLKKDAEERGTPIRTVLKNLDQPADPEMEVSHAYINGLYPDGLPWAGVFAKVNFGSSKKKWQFSVISTKDKPKSVLDFVEEFSSSTGRNVKAAWNGGYILNPELVGKLGIPEKFIGSPLGLIISNKKVLSPPLFNKPAFIVLPDGKLQIRRVNSSNGITLSDSTTKIKFSPDAYNPEQPINKPCFYDLLFPADHLEGGGRIIVRLSGNTIIDIIQTQENEKVPVLPVGITLSFPRDQFPKTWDLGMALNLTMNGWEKITSAIEAGPQLLKDGEVCIDMEIEGWKTQNSINTQAARLDFLDSRGPKIAVGIDKGGDLTVLTINGRIRESVGATHGDMAEILKSQGMEFAMGFDPGGSSTLVVENKVLNISPYNSEYEKDVYSLPPEPRAIASAIIVSEA